MTAATVHSPAGIRLVSGLLGPFLTEAGQRELETRWNTPVEVLFKESVDMAAEVGAHPALHAALGVWTRDHTLPVEAATRLGEYLKELPLSPKAAQAVLDAWASDNTAQMIPTFPCTVDDDTHAVLASAVAVDDEWARKTDEMRTLFADQYVKGFQSQTDHAGATATADGNGVRVTLPLRSGLLMQFVLATGGVEQATALLETPDVFVRPVVDGDPFVSTQKVTWETTDVAVRLPEYTTRARLDIGAERAKWGLEAAMRPAGVPGLGMLEITAAVQDAFIEVTHTGVRAAAVTAMMLTRASASFQPDRFDQRVVTFNEPFAYQMVLPGHATPLFAGTYSG